MDSRVVLDPTVSSATVTQLSQIPFQSVLPSLYKNGADLIPINISYKYGSKCVLSYTDLDGRGHYHLTLVLPIGGGAF